MNESRRYARERPDVPTSSALATRHAGPVAARCETRVAEDPCADTRWLPLVGQDQNLLQPGAGYLLVEQLSDHAREPVPMPRIISRSLSVALTAVFLLPLLVFGYAGTFTRCVADDYCTASVVLERGLAGAQQFWYLNWNGRSAFVLVIDVLNWLGAWTVPVTPTVLLAAWCFAAWAALRETFALGPGRDAPGRPLLIAFAIVATEPAGAPGLWQSLYWQTGSITYLLPVVFASAAVAMTLRVYRLRIHPRQRALWLAAATVSVVLAVGSNETAMGLIVGGLCVASAALFVFYRGGQRRVLLTAVGVELAAAIIASAAVILAPGNAERENQFWQPDPWLSTIYTAWFPFYVVLQFLMRAPVYAVLAYALPNLLARRAGAVEARSLVLGRRLTMLAAYLVIAAAGAPAFFATGGLPPRARSSFPNAHW